MCKGEVSPGTFGFAFDGDNQVVSLEHWHINFFPILVAGESAEQNGHVAKKQKRSKPKPGADPLLGADLAVAAAAVAAAGAAGGGAQDAALQEAVLETLAGLLRAGGAVLPQEVRVQLDAVAAHAAATAAAAAERQRRSSDASADAVAAAGRLRLAAARALLASVLAPCGHRPVFLTPALRLFQKVWSENPSCNFETAFLTFLKLFATHKKP